MAISAEAAVTDAARTAAPPGALGLGFDVGRTVAARGHVRPLIGTNHFAQTASKFDDTRDQCLDLRPLSMEFAYKLEICAV